MQTRKTRASREKYKELRRVEKQAHKRKKRAHNEETFEQLEKVNSQHEARKFYQILIKVEKNSN